MRRFPGSITIITWPMRVLNTCGLTSTSPRPSSRRRSTHRQGSPVAPLWAAAAAVTARVAAESMEMTLRKWDRDRTSDPTTGTTAKEQAAADLDEVVQCARPFTLKRPFGELPVRLFPTCGVLLKSPVSLQQMNFTLFTVAPCLRVVFHCLSPTIDPLKLSCNRFRQAQQLCDVCCDCSYVRVTSAHEYLAYIYTSLSDV